MVKYNNSKYKVLVIKGNNDTTDINKDFDYEAMILNNVKSNDLQNIGTITLILEDTICIKDRENQYFGLPKDDVFSIEANKEVILKKNYLDVLESKVNLPEEVYNRDSIIEVKLDLVTKGKVKSKKKGQVRKLLVV